MAKRKAKASTVKLTRPEFDTAEDEFERLHKLAEGFGNVKSEIERLKGNLSGVWELVFFWCELTALRADDLYVMDGRFTCDPDPVLYGLTDVLAAWCDSAKTEIDPSPLLQARNTWREIADEDAGIAITGAMVPDVLKRQFESDCRGGLATCQRIELALRTWGIDQPETMPKKRKSKWLWLGPAIELVMADPHRTDSSIAEEVGKHPSTLCNDDWYRKARLIAEMNARIDHPQIGGKARRSDRIEAERAADEAGGSKSRNVGRGRLEDVADDR